MFGKLPLYCCTKIDYWYSRMDLDLFLELHVVLDQENVFVLAFLIDIAHLVEGLELVLG
jgi:hypothetical protein